MTERSSLTPERLAQLLDKLTDVMNEAERLRREVTRQLGEQRHRLQQRVTSASGKKRKITKHR